jgi:PAS domain S-box-containing protein
MSIFKAKEPQVNKELYLRIIDQFPNPIWRAGTDAKCNFFNKAWLAFTGRTMEQEMGNGWAEGVHKEDFDMCLKIYLDAFKKREHFEMNYRIKHHDGTYHWIFDSGSPFFDDDGTFLGYIGSCYDINDTKKHVTDIELMNAMMVDRELKMVEMKKQIELLEKKINAV